MDCVFRTLSQSLLFSCRLLLAGCLVTAMGRVIPCTPVKARPEIIYPDPCGLLRFLCLQFPCFQQGAAPASECKVFSFPHNFILLFIKNEVSLWHFPSDFSLAVSLSLVFFVPLPSLPLLVAPLQSHVTQHLHLFTCFPLMGSYLVSKSSPTI